MQGCPTGVECDITTFKIRAICGSSGVGVPPGLQAKDTTRMPIHTRATAAQLYCCYIRLYRVLQANYVSWPTTSMYKERELSMYVISPQQGIIIGCEQPMSHPHAPETNHDQPSTIRCLERHTKHDEQSFLTTATRQELSVRPAYHLHTRMPASRGPQRIRRTTSPRGGECSSRAAGREPTTAAPGPPRRSRLRQRPSNTWETSGRTAQRRITTPLSSHTSVSRSECSPSHMRASP